MMVMVFGVDFVVRLSGIVRTMSSRINLKCLKGFGISNLCELPRTEFVRYVKCAIGVVRWDER